VGLFSTYRGPIFNLPWAYFQPIVGLF
jgi:hypothetical protein